MKNEKMKAVRKDNRWCIIQLSGFMFPIVRNMSKNSAHKTKPRYLYRQHFEQKKAGIFQHAAIARNLCPQRVLDIQNMKLLFNWWITTRHKTHLNII